MRSVGIVKRIDEDPAENDREFKLAVQWIVCGDVPTKDGGSFLAADPNEWPGMSFDGGDPYVVLRKLLTEYAPKRWGDNCSLLHRMELVEEAFASSAQFKQEQRPDDMCIPVTPALLKNVHVIQEALYHYHQEPCLVLDADCITSRPPRPPFRCNHANCISDANTMCPEEGSIMLKDSNDEHVRPIQITTPGLLVNDGHYGSGPQIIWIRPKLDDIKVLAPLAVSSRKLQNTKTESQPLCSCSCITRFKKAMRLLSKNC
jgi:hypothetical protein